MKTNKQYTELDVRYSTDDNISISGILTLPLSVKKPPIVILAHGFCGDKNENGFFIQAATNFYKHGYAVLRFDFRGCGDSEGEFEKVRLRDTRRDLLATVRFIKSKRDLLDCDNIAFVGFSLGATLGLLSNIADIKTFAFWSPAFSPRNDMYPRYLTDQVKDQINNHGYFIKSNLKVSKHFLEDLGSCDTTSIIENFDKPVLVIHGKKDQRINWQSSEAAFNKIKDKQNKLLMFVEDGSHSFKENAGDRLEVINSTITWFDTYLKSHEPYLNGFNNAKSLNQSQAASSWAVMGKANLKPTNQNAFPAIKSSAFTKRANSRLHVKKTTK